MFGEIFVVLGVERGQRDVMSQAARGYPRVVYWPWATSERGVGRDGAPGARYVVVAVQDVRAGQPLGEAFAAVWSPLTLFDPSSQFREGHERDDG